MGREEDDYGDKVVDKYWVWVVKDRIDFAMLEVGE